MMPPCLAHAREGDPGQQKRGSEVHGQRAVPSFDVELFDGSGRVGAGGVDQHVYAPEGFDGSLDRSRCLGLASRESAPGGRSLRSPP